MNKITQEFLNELKNKPEVVGIILFGSWARGNNRIDSDVDLLVILTDGYRRIVEYKDGQAFEIIYNTANGALDFWKSHKDDCANLWEVAKIIYDKDGTIENLKKKALEIIQEGKKLIDSYQMAQFRFSAEDELSSVDSLINSDITTANLVLQKTILSLTELFFDLRQLWTPAPKQRLAKIKENNPDLYNLISEFYSQENHLEDKLKIAKKIIIAVFEI